MTIRKNDIIKRKEITNSKIIEREELLKEKNNRDERRNLELEDYKKKLDASENQQEIKNFDENAWLENWDSMNKSVIVPTEINHDVDDDFSFE